MAEQRIDQGLFSAVAADALGRGEAVVLRVKGSSMEPWLPEGRRVRVAPATGRRVRRGDVVFFLRAPDRPILHRVVRVGGTREAPVYECLGDAEIGDPERVSAERVLGVVEAPAGARMAYRLLQPLRKRANAALAARGIRLRHG
jgi:signal peptidase I